MISSRGWITIGFIVFATAIFYFIGQPAKVLVVVGALNGFILPIALGILLIESHCAQVQDHGERLSSSGLADLDRLDRGCLHGLLQHCRGYETAF